MGLPHITASIILSKLERVCLEGFCERTGWNLWVSRLPIPAPFCCDVSEKKEISWIRHETSVMRPCTRVISTMEDFQAIWCENAWSILDTQEVQIIFLELNKAGDFCCDEEVHTHTFEGRMNSYDRLSDHFQSKNASFTVLGDVPNIYCFELLQNPLHGIPYLLKQCTFKLLSSARVIKKPSRVERQRQPLSQMRALILRGVNSLHAVIE